MPEAIPHSFPFRLAERRVGDGPPFRGMLQVTADGAANREAGWPLSLLVEAMAQAILLVSPPQETEGLRLVALDRVRQLREVQAGDRLEVEVEASGTFGNLRRFTCRASCGGALVATAGITVASERGKSCS